LQQQNFAGYNGIALAADVGGGADKPPVVLLHGGGQTRHSWGEAAGRLADRGYRVVSLDLRGHGDSGWASDEDYSIDALVQDLKAVLATLGQPAALVGASIGGVSSLIAVGESATRIVSALVLVDIAPKMDAAGAERIKSFMTARSEGFGSVEEAADAVAAYLPHRPRPADISGLRKNLRVGAGQRLYWHWDPAFPNFKRFNPEEIRLRMEKAAKAVRVPTLIVRGERSEMVSNEAAHALRSSIPHAEYAQVSKAHHMVAGDANDAFSNVVIDFLDRHRLA
jgi:non-heme chloroperoxidase